MSEENLYVLNDWGVLGNRLVGVAENHPRFPSKRIVTSKVVEYLGDSTFRTSSGSRYKLGEVSASGKMNEEAAIRLLKIFCEESK